MKVTTHRRTRYQRLLIGPDVTLVVSAIGIDPEGVGWVRLAVQVPDDVEIVKPEKVCRFPRPYRRGLVQGTRPTS